MNVTSQNHLNTLLREIMRLRIICALLLAMPLCTAAQTYKCKQADGKVSFQDQPCQDGATGSRIIVRATAPSVDPAEIQRMKAAASKDRQQAAQAQKDNEELKARDQQAQAHNRSVRCSIARQNLGAMKTQRPVFRYDNNGDRQYIEDSDRPSEIAAAQRGVAENCN